MIKEEEEKMKDQELEDGIGKAFNMMDSLLGKSEMMSRVTSIYSQFVSM